MGLEALLKESKMLGPEATLTFACVRRFRTELDGRHIARAFRSSACVGSRFYVLVLASRR